MTTVQIIPGDFQITDPDWPIYKIKKTITSDDFSVAGALNGVMTDARLGGDPMAWATTGNHAKSDGALRVGSTMTAAGALNLRGLPADVSATVVLRSFNAPSDPEKSRMNLSLRADVDSTEAWYPSVIMHIYPDGRLALEERNPTITTETYVTSEPGQWVLGDAITLRVVGNTATALVNGQQVFEHAVQKISAGALQMSHHLAANAFQVESLVVADA